MNLKYNRIDMKKAETEGTHTMRLRSRPSSSQNLKPKAVPTRDKKQKRPRQFGADLTNHPLPEPMDLELPLPPLAPLAAPRCEL